MAPSAGSPPPDRPPAVVDWGAMVGRLIDDRAWFDGMVATVTEEIHRRVPELGDDPDLVRATAESVADNLRLFGAIAHGRIDGDRIDLPALAVEWARRLAHRGVPLDALLRTYQTAHVTVWRVWAGLLRDELDDPAAIAAAIEQGSEAMFAFIDALVDRARDVYREEREQWARSSAALRAETVRALLDGATIDLTTAGQRLRYDLRRHHVALLAWDAAGERAPAELERAVGEAARAIGAGAPLVVTLTGGSAAAWVGTSEAPDPAQLERAVRVPEDAAGVRLAVGGVGRGLEGFRRSHREALHARRVAGLGGAGEPVTHYRAVAAAALASVDLEGARELVEQQLGPLLAVPEGRELLATLRVYLQEQGRPRRAAARLGVHENTIANRVRRIEDLLRQPLEGRVTELLLAATLAPLLGAQSPVAPASARSAAAGPGFGATNR
ncbi:PucR family transcriptional regulator [Patulibacter defluvii]|uniref:PucR family transcriptional regulator n=1 Tax=Patulibacter defluvii TaxID=3095358 RepID=UPI002A75C1B3|nr:helix-turn-helix domain-containing protein [Patulibacter sp. DM4]